MPAVNFDVEAGTAWLLGNDIRSIVSPITREYLLGILNDNALLTKMSRQMLQSSVDNEAQSDRVWKYLTWLTRGIAGSEL